MPVFPEVERGSILELAFGIRKKGRKGYYFF